MGTADKPLRLIGYCRVSTEEQAKDGVSLDAQRARIGAWCAAQGYELVRVEVDEGISAKTIDARPGLRRVLEAVRAREVGGLIVAKFDRLTRSLIDCCHLIEEAEKRGWALVSVEQAIDTSTAGGRMVAKIFGVVAEWEREAIAERTSVAMAHIKAQGRRAGQIPYGMRLRPGVPGGALEPDLDEQRIIAAILDMSRQGIVPGGIAEALNGAHVPARGERWHRTTIRRILAAQNGGG